MAIKLTAGPWHFSVNHTWEKTSNSDSGEVASLMALKETMLGLGWSVIASSNQTSVKNVGDSDPDLWQSTADLHRGTGARSWAVFRDDTMCKPLYVDFYGSSACSAKIGWYYNDNVGSDGTTSALPSGDRVQSTQDGVYEILAPTSTTYYWMPGGTWHGMTSADRKTLRLLNTTWYQGQQLVSATIISLEKLVDTPSACIGDVYWTNVRQRHTSGSPLSANLFSADESYNKAIYNIGSGNVVANVSLSALVWHAYTGGTGNYAGTNNKAPEFDNYQRYFTPIGVYDPAAGPLGRVPDLWLVPDMLIPYATYPADGTRQLMRVGVLAVPWNGEKPLFPGYM